MLIRGTDGNRLSSRCSREENVIEETGVPTGTVTLTRFRFAKYLCMPVQCFEWIFLHDMQDEIEELQQQITETTKAENDHGEKEDNAIDAEVILLYF